VAAETTPAGGRDVSFIQDTYWMLLGRAATPSELADEQQGHLNKDQRTLLRGIMASSEFGRLRRAWRDGRETHADPATVERALTALGPPDVFIRRAYELMLGRQPDEGGARHYLTAMKSGERRMNILRGLAISEEFERRWRAIPRDTQLCELANPAKWDNEEWLDLLRSLGLSDDRLVMHRKPYEFTQLLYGCRRLGALRDDASFLSVGAGHEHVLYWLANHVRRVVATDMYEGVWQGERAREGDPIVLEHPEQYAPFPYRRDHLEFLRMDGRSLKFPDETFDVTYSLSSIEHFGGFDGAAQTMREMARVLKRGGILALATEYVLSGPSHEETFQPAEVHALLNASGLTLVEPIDERVYNRYESEPVDLADNPYRSPHMTVRLGDTIFTSVMAFLRKQ
jgi:SAM-dependent methyltransferase